MKKTIEKITQNCSENLAIVYRADTYFIYDFYLKKFIKYKEGAALITLQGDIAYKQFLKSININK